MRAVAGRLVVALAGGLAVGGAVSMAGSGATAAARASTAAVLVFCLAVPWAASSPPADGGPRARLLGAGGITACVALAALVAIVSGGREARFLSSPAAALVPAAAAALAHGIAGIARRAGTSAGGAAFAGCALPFALAGLVFVADPWIEWEGSTPRSQGRADLVYAVNPLASLTALEGGTGLDWQTSGWLYDGPAPGQQGLTVVGQFYPSRPSSPWLWSLALGGLGLGLALGAGRAPAPAREAAEAD